MTNRFSSPNQQFFLNPVTGAPLAGGKLYFYVTASATPQNTYTTQALSVANANPIILDANGYSGNVFLSNAAYKVVLTDSNGVIMWTADPVWASDYSTMAQVLPWAGNPNGLVAGTAGVQGALPGSSMVWDYTNDILYVCTTSGTAGTTVWTAVNASSTSTAVSYPQGYLTLTSGVPVIPTDVTAATVVYYTPYNGNTLPIYNGSSFSPQSFTELSLTLTASQASNTIYDIFVINDSGVLTLVTGPAWTTLTAGAGARGAGAGTTELTRLNGLLVNNVQISARNGATTYTVAANLGTYVGSIYIDAAAGQVSCHRTFGQNHKWGLWNCYNRQPIELVAGDATASWAYAVATIRQSNAATGNKLTTFCGLAEELVYVTFSQKHGTSVPIGNVVINPEIGIGVNSTTVMTGARGAFNLDGPGGGPDVGGQTQPTASATLTPVLGINNVNCLEKGDVNGTQTFFGTESYMRMTARYRG